jgi:NAD(P)-dependent dehydrogenase (short-subunit alcohol dehydrogenase family)
MARGWMARSLWSQAERKASAKPLPACLRTVGAHGLVICGRNAANGARVRDMLTALGTAAVFVEADLARITDVRAVIDAADKAFGRIDVLVNAAGP